MSHKTFLLWAALGLFSLARAAQAGPVTAVVPGFDHTCAITTGGVVMCWGYNASGQLGDGTTTNRPTPAPVSGLGSGVSAIGSGYEHTCAVISDGGLKCWGSNIKGQLGDGTINNAWTPVSVPGLSGLAAVTGGRHHTCALTSAGAVWCWGRNDSGQLGDGTSTSRMAPVAVAGLSSGVSAIAAGEFHTCAIASGTLRCWGDNSHGQLGDGTHTQRTAPTAVAGLSSVTAVTAGPGHTCALTGGALYCWGDNSNGQLAANFSADKPTPQALAGFTSGTAGAAANGGQTCALSGGAVSCWGQNNNGQLGDGTTITRSTPQAVGGLSGAPVAIAAGYAHTCALITGGDLNCWGRNGAGQVGNGSTGDSLVPALVTFPVIPTISLDRTSLAFAATRGSAAFVSQTAAQIVRLQQSAGPAVSWTATASDPWLTVSPASGAGAAALTIAVRFDPSVPATGTLQGTVTISATGAANALPPISIRLAVLTTSATPFGSFDTPAGDGTVLAGSTAVTGWTLDDVGVKRVEIWRDLQSGETTPPFASTPSDPRNGKVFIANAVFVEGARPDVEGLYPNMPLAYRAGWGYLLLTWGLWNQGNGIYKFYAYAFDQEDHVATIGSKTIVVNNNAAAKPFGSIDTPAIGGNPGTSPNFGWGLTPLVNGAATCRIPSSGVQVSIDSGPLQPVVYGDARSDIAGAFPGFSNSAAAGGHFSFDWSTLSNGPHTIGWLITDDCNRADGVGSRFFNVTTGTNLLAAPGNSSLRVNAELARVRVPESDAPITVARGYGELPLVVDPGLAGSRTIELKQGERIEIRLPRGFDSAYQLGPGGQTRSLPLGATWDGDSGIFFWQPAAGFLGRYRLVFSNGAERISVRVRIVP